MKITTEETNLTPCSFSELKPGDVFSVSNPNNDRRYFMKIKTKEPCDDNVISLKDYELYFCFAEVQVFRVNADSFASETKII